MIVPDISALFEVTNLPVPIADFHRTPKLYVRTEDASPSLFAVRAEEEDYLSIQWRVRLDPLAGRRKTPVSQAKVAITVANQGIAEHGWMRAETSHLTHCDTKAGSFVMTHNGHARRLPVAEGLAVWWVLWSTGRAIHDALVNL